ncbi:hypothetical protein D3C87_1835580 [compost metagenome]
MHGLRRQKLRGMGHATGHDRRQEGELGLRIEQEQVADRAVVDQRLEQAGFGMTADRPGGTRIA